MRVAQWRTILLACLLSVLLGVETSLAQKRVALVIGNGAYQKVGKLNNPGNDANAVAALLRSAGFDVALHENLGIRQMRQAVNDFADIAQDADTAAVYYSGHGMEVNGINYLIPVDAVLARDTDVPYETISLDNLVQVMEPARRLRLVMLDACRDNPFFRTMKRTVGTRAIGRGLAAVEPTSVNTLISYAAKAGSYALDGEGSNSPYVLSLLNHLPTPGLDLRIAFGRVRDDVLKVTRNKQEPFVYGSLGGANISIIDSPGASVTVVVPPGQGQNTFIDRAAQAWGVIQTTTSIAVIEDFIRQFGTTPYGSMARARLEELKKSKVAAVPPLSNPTGPKPAAPTGPCAHIVGTWLWYNGATVTVNSNGTTTQSDGNSATVVCADGVYTFTWLGIHTVRMALSSDGKRLSGTGMFGPETAVRQRI
jgi:Caspase domain